MSKLARILWLYYPWREAYYAYREICWDTNTQAMGFMEWLKSGGYKRGKQATDKT